MVYTSKADAPLSQRAARGHIKKLSKQCVRSFKNVPLMSERFTKARRTALATKDKNLFPTKS